MLPSVAVGQLLVEQAHALSVEPPVPRYLRNPYTGYWPGHSSATGLAGTGILARGTGKNGCCGAGGSTRSRSTGSGRLSEDSRSAHRERGCVGLGVARKMGGSQTPTWRGVSEE